MKKDAALARLAALAVRLRAMGATSMYLFGSTIRGDARAQSDLDLFIDYNPQSHFSLIELVGIKQMLEEELHIPVDITTRDSLHPALRSVIEATAVALLWNLHIEALDQPLARAAKAEGAMVIPA